MKEYPSLNPCRSLLHLDHLAPLHRRFRRARPGVNSEALAVQVETLQAWTFGRNVGGHSFRAGHSLGSGWVAGGYRIGCVVVGGGVDNERSKNTGRITRRGERLEVNCDL